MKGKFGSYAVAAVVFFRPGTLDSQPLPTEDDVVDNSPRQEAKTEIPDSESSATTSNANAKPSPETLNLLLKAKFDVLIILVHVFMLWWVSATAFCASIVGATWYKKESLQEISLLSTNVLCAVIFIFFTSIHTFGWFGVIQAGQLQRHTDAILRQLKIPNDDCYGHTEFYWFKHSILLANVSFVLVSIIWVGVWVWLVTDNRRRVNLESGGAPFSAIYDLRRPLPSNSVCRVPISKRSQYFFRISGADR
jgi:hypothetical protein